MLQIENIAVGYGAQPVLRLKSLSLPRGGQCLLTGPSGSGKTSLLYAIAGLLPLQSGSIAIDGTQLASLSESQRDRFRGRHIGIIFQTLHLIKSLSVLDNLLLSSYVAGLPQQRGRAVELLRQLGVYDKKDAMPHQLSQGQAQRVAIARSVLQGPSLLLADEPTSSLDDDSCAAVISLIKQVAQDANAALLISTHDSRVKAHFSEMVHIRGAA